MFAIIQNNLSTSDKILLLCLKLKSLIQNPIKIKPQTKFPITIINFAIGIIIYLNLNSEPNLINLIIITIIITLLTIIFKNITIKTLTITTILPIIIGITYAQIHDLNISKNQPAPNLQGAHQIKATVIKWNDLGKKHYLTININNLNQQSQNFKARIRLYTSQIPENLKLGDQIEIFAKIAQPKPAQIQNGFSARQYFWMQKIHYSGFAITSAKIIKKYNGQWLGFKNIKNFIHYKIFSWRNKIATNIRSSIQGNKGEVAVALLTGLRGKISEENKDNMRYSGLAHLLAISGIHMSCVAISVFFIIRLFLALYPPFALKQPIKKIAAIAALIATFIYLLLAGGSISVERAWMMTSLALIAVLLDRRIFNMRIVAITALIILVFQPRQITSVGFQLSFLAVIALTAFFEWKSKVAKQKQVSDNITIRSFSKFATPIKIATLTTLIAGLATAPAISHYFGYVTPWSLGANLFAVPLTALVIIPSGLAGLVLMPIGAHPIPLFIMGHAIAILLEIASFFRDLPSGEWSLFHINATGYTIFVVGLLFLSLWKGKSRLLGLGVCVVAFIVWGMSSKPDLMIQGNKEIFAVQLDDGSYGLYNQGRSRYISDRWQSYYGLGEFQEISPNINSENIKCDEFGCHIGDEFKIVLSFNKNHLPSQCATADYLIAYYDRGDFRPCYRYATRFITYSDLKSKGAVFVYGDEVRFAVSQTGRLWQNSKIGLAHKNLVNK